MQNTPFNSNYEIAHITSKDEEAIKNVEKELKSKTGKDLIVIAWEKK